VNAILIIGSVVMAGIILMVAMGAMAKKKMPFPSGNKQN
jgi:hypothetical protein